MNHLMDMIKGKENDSLKKELKNDPSIADASTEQGISLLQFAVYCRNTEAVEMIRAYKSHLDIFEAASLGEREKIKQLSADHPELLNSFSPDGFTVLGLVAFFGHLKLAEELLENGVNPNVPANNQFKVTPLHSACATSNLAMARLLIEYGADVNAKQMQGVTPLHSAAHNGQIDLVKLLIDCGADTNAKMENGQTPLSMAEEAKSTDTAEFLRQIKP